MSDEDFDREIRNIRSQRNFARLSVQLIEVALQRSEGIIRETLDQFEERVREPEPNPNRFIGYIRYDKESYVDAYERLKPTRDLVRLLNTFLPDMRNMRDRLQERYGSLLEQQRLRQLQAQFQNQALGNDPQNNAQNNANQNEERENGDGAENEYAANVADPNCEPNCEY